MNRASLTKSSVEDLIAFNEKDLLDQILLAKNNGREVMELKEKIENGHFGTE